MQKTLTYAMLLAATLGLAACGEKSDHKVEPANTAAPQASQSTGDAAAVEQKAAEATETLPPPPRKLPLPPNRRLPKQPRVLLKRRSKQKPKAPCLLMARRFP